MTDQEEGQRHEALQKHSFVLTPLDPSQIYEESGGFGLGLYLQILWKRRRLIVIGTLLFGLAALALAFLWPKTYRAKAILFVSPPRFSTELRPPILSVTTYQTIIESEAIKRKLEEELKKEKGSEYPAGDNFSVATSIYTPTRRDESPLPLIDLIVEAENPERASRIANLWAGIVVREIGDLSNRAKIGTIDFIEREYPESRQRLEEAELELLASNRQYDRLTSELNQRFDKQIADFKARWNLDALREELKARQWLLTQTGERGLLVQLESVQMATKRARDTLQELKKEIVAHPQFLVLSKAITDDALWEKIGTDSSGDVSKDLSELSLKTQILNSVYSRLAQRLSDVQVEYESLLPQEAYLKEQIAQQEARIQELNQLIQQKEVELQNLERRRSLELGLLRRERLRETGSLERRVDSARQTYRTLSEKYESARLTKTEESVDLRVGAVAVTPDKPISPRKATHLAIGLSLGLFLTVLTALFAEYLQAVAKPR